MKGGEPIFIDKNSKIGVLMLHGFTSTPAQFKELGSFLAGKGFNVSAPLVAGHGTSPSELLKTSPKDWTKSVLDAYIELKKISKKVFIIGNSFGSNLAFWIAKETENDPAGIITLGAPIFLKYHRFLIFRLYSYGLLQKYYKKPKRIYKTDYTDMSDEITYPIMPTKSTRQFFSFIKNETMPNLEKIKIPVFVCHSDTDPVVRPDSATYIYQHLGSAFKKLYWFESRSHVITDDSKNKPKLFKKIYDFIKEVDV